MLLGSCIKPSLWAGYVYAGVASYFGFVGMEKASPKNHSDADTAGVSTAVQPGHGLETVHWPGRMQS